MEAIEKLKQQISSLMNALEIEREYIAEMRARIEFLEAQITAKNEVIVSLEDRISELAGRMDNHHKQYYG